MARNPYPVDFIRVWEHVYTGCMHCGGEFLRRPGETGCHKSPTVVGVWQEKGTCWINVGIHVSVSRLGIVHTFQCLYISN